MKMKKITANSMQEATIQIRQQLGKDAVILNSKTVVKRKLFGLKKQQMVEVIAVLDQDFEERAGKGLNPASPLPVLPKKEKLPEEPSFVPKAAKPAPSHTQPLEYVRNERHAGILPDPLIAIDQKLKDQGLDDAIRDECLKGLLTKGAVKEYHIKKELEQLLTDMLPAQTSDEPMISSKYIVLFGSTGAGKTTTIAKLAAKTAIQQQKKIAFITTDTYRIAAIEQLKTYAELLNAPLEVCYSREDFVKAQETFKEYDHIFIDTAGRNFKEEAYIKELTDIIPFDESIQSFLVMSATSKYQDMKAMVKRFEHVPINQFIFTKVDETDTMGTIFQIIADSQIKLGFLTNGQNVPEDILEGSPLELTRMVLQS
ncbi:flagellar biosynthesis protein FlhF [Bacillus safensis]|uniref:flagellar biosynthesis protein FlhF n=1 Tax=Bacillus TaxID=1386 RepID=UPI00045D2CE8|nr:flagellar biosynthesis protein FlhF [Bacillus safensis]AWI36677.1 flagellar biosynthesis protein FlhF [Bacillus safensis FO-36b]KDE27801.1 flagellar biosynthesis regulator FlhF [Bacillus safensis FO-36b]MCM3047212.1 flagellar biosynthesis protein FlhF [Bacillus safensis]MEC1045464.1 flagellar biosynthesis protein FlhF [Bacillus safensis]MEC2426448.1 flagellar biosynthesis protein FlhF [Bacillus safensis]